MVVVCVPETRNASDQAYKHKDIFSSISSNHDFLVDSSNNDNNIGLDPAVFFHGRVPEDTLSGSKDIYSPLSTGPRTNRRPWQPFEGTSGRNTRPYIILPDPADISSSARTKGTSYLQNTPLRNIDEARASQYGYYHKRQKSSGVTPSFVSNTQLRNFVHVKKRGRALLSDLQEENTINNRRRTFFDNQSEGKRRVKCTSPSPNARKGYMRCFAPPCTIGQSEPSHVISSWLTSLIEDTQQ